MAAVSAYFKIPTSEVLKMTFLEVLDCNEIIWQDLENQYRATEAHSPR